MADDLRRIVDYDDYGVNPEFFAYIDSLYGPHSIDRFANECNAVLPRYNSLFYTPSTEAVDAFSVDWRFENNWLVPPVYFIPKALNHLRCCSAKGIVVAPDWPSSPFFPMLFGNSACFKPFIVETLVFKCDDIYKQGMNKMSIFGSKYFTSKVLVIRLDCS